MTSTFFPGVAFLDALPTGEYAAQTPQKPIDTHLGPVPLPPGEPWGVHYIRVSNVGGFHFGGQAHTRPAGAPPLFWEWRADTRAWTSRVVPFGRGAYDFTGVFRDAAPNGVRYVDETTGQPVTNGATYNDPVHGLSEWTDFAGLRIGQGNGDPDGGVLLWDGTNKRIVVQPPTYAIFVNVARAGENVAISYVGQGGATRLLTTLTELRACPIVRAAAPPPPPVTPPPTPPTPSPSPEPVTMTLPESVHQTILRYAAIAPVPQGQGPEDFDPSTGGASDAFENKARAWTLGLAEQVRFDAQDARWGVKNAGGGRPQSKDSIAFNADHLYNFDVLSGVGTGKPSLSIPTTAEVIDGQQFMPVSAIDHVGGGQQPVPPSPPSPVDPNEVALAARVGALETALAHLLSSQQDTENRIAALETRPAPVIPDLSTVAHKGDKVTVKVPILGPAHGSIDT